MAEVQVALQEKKELKAPEERTEAGKFYSPYTDIHETGDAVLVSMEVPGVDKSAIDIRLEKGVLTVTANIDSSKYAGFRPIYRSTTSAISCVALRCPRRSTATRSPRPSRTAC